MKIYDMVRDEKLQYDINREAEKISPFSSGNIDNYEYLTGEKILPTGQKKSDKTSYIYIFSFRKSLERQTKSIKD